MAINLKNIQKKKYLTIFREGKKRKLFQKCTFDCRFRIMEKGKHNYVYCNSNKDKHMFQILMHVNKQAIHFQKIK